MWQVDGMDLARRRLYIRDRDQGRNDKSTYVSCFLLLIYTYIYTGVFFFCGRKDEDSVATIYIYTRVVSRALCYFWVLESRQLSVMFAAR